MVWMCCRRQFNYIILYCSFLLFYFCLLQFLPSAPSQFWWFPKLLPAVSRLSPSDGRHPPIGCSGTACPPPGGDSRASGPQTPPTTDIFDILFLWLIVKNDQMNAVTDLRWWQIPYLFVKSSPGFVWAQTLASAALCFPPPTRCCPAADEPRGTCTPWRRHGVGTSAAPPPDRSVGQKQKTVWVLMCGQERKRVIFSCHGNHTFHDGTLDGQADTDGQCVSNVCVYDSRKQMVVTRKSVNADKISRSRMTDITQVSNSV